MLGQVLRFGGKGSVKGSRSRGAGCKGAARIERAVAGAFVGESLERRLLLTVLTAAQVRAAYGVDQISLGGTTGDASGQTIAIVVAYDDPTNLTDLNSFSANSGGAAGMILPQFNAGSGPTFTEMDQNGTVNSRPNNAGATNLTNWQNEQSLDMEWAHAIAPNANIVVVEANSGNKFDLFAAELTAASVTGVSVVSNSWSVTGGEYSTETSDDGTFLTPTGHSNVAFVASAGDFGANDRTFAATNEGYPSFSPNVLSVGGTALTATTIGGTTSYSETAWTYDPGTGFGGGGGRTQFEAEQSWQIGSDNGTSVTSASTYAYRVSPDVAMVADETTSPLYFINTTTQPSGGGVQSQGGTSFGAPIWAGLIAIANQGRQIRNGGTANPLNTDQVHSALYGMSPSFFKDVTTGNNGYPATTGYDLATGLGSPVANLLVPALAGYTVGTQLAFASPPTTTITAGTSALPPLTIHIDDASGTLITTDNSSVTLSVYESGGTNATLLGGPVTVNAVNGVATFNNLWLDTPPMQSGTYQLVATVPGDVAATFSFTVAPSTAHGSVTPSAVVGFNGASAPKGQGPHGSLLTDSSGNMYGTTEFGGANGVGTVFEIDAASHALTMLASFGSGSTDPNEPECTLAIDASGNLFGTTVGGGANGYGALFELAHGSGTITTLASFSVSTTGEYPDGAVVLDGSGNIYGTTPFGSTTTNGDGTIFKYTLSTSTLSALVSLPSDDSKGGHPHGGLAIDAAGNLYGTTTTYHIGLTGFDGSVFEISGSTLTTLGVFTGPNGNNPQGTLVLDSQGNLYGTTEQGGLSTAPGYGTVFEIVNGTKTITVLASLSSSDPANPYGGLLVDGNGNLYGTATTGGANSHGGVFELAAGTYTVATLASFSTSGTVGYASYGGLVSDADGNLYGTASQGGAHLDGTVFELGSIAIPAWLEPGSQAEWNASSQTLNVRITGSATANSSANYAGAWVIANPHVAGFFNDLPAVTVTGDTGKTVFLRISPTNADTQVELGALAISSGGRGVVDTTASNDSLLLDLQGLTLGSGSTLDMGNSWLLLHYSGASPLSTVQGYITNGYDGGLWDGLGTGVSGAGALWSSSAAESPAHYAMGYADSASGVVSGQSSNTIEILYTRMGDANLDRIVNLGDVNIISQNYNGTGASWEMGDFNFDGIVNLGDVNIVSQNYNGTA